MLNPATLVAEALGAQLAHNYRDIYGPRKEE